MQSFGLELEFKAYKTECGLVTTTLVGTEISHQLLYGLTENLESSIAIGERNVQTWMIIFSSELC